MPIPTFPVDMGHVNPCLEEDHAQSESAGRDEYSVATSDHLDSGIGQCVPRDLGDLTSSTLCPVFRSLAPAGSQLQ
jgi:hypothetical protein